MNTAKLFKNGQSQAVRLPKHCRFIGDEVIIKKIGDAVLLMPVIKSWDRLLNSIELFPSDIEWIRDADEIKEKDLFK
jgi:antitoxin VapB